MTPPREMGCSRYLGAPPGGVKWLERESALCRLHQVERHPP
jgi:hypothetical protein